MIKVENHIGKITISNNYLTELIWNAVTDCFGVVDMNACSLWDDVKSHVLKRSKKNGVSVSVRVRDNNLIINIHMSVTFGTNISAIVSSMKNKVRFAVEQAAGITVEKINVSIDNMSF